MMQEAITVMHGLSCSGRGTVRPAKGVCEGTVLSYTRSACSRGYKRGERGREAPRSALSCTGGACSRGYKRGERGRETLKSLVEEVIEASANIGAQGDGCVCVLRVMCV